MVKYLKQAQPQPRQISRDSVERVRDMLDDIEQNRGSAVRGCHGNSTRGRAPIFVYRTTILPPPAKP